MSREADFWGEATFGAIIITGLLIAGAFVVELLALSDIKDNSDFRRGFYSTLAGRPIDNPKTEDINDGILVGRRFKEIMKTGNFEDKERLKALFNFHTLSNEIHEVDIFKEPKRIETILFGSTEDKKIVFNEISAPVSRRKIWKISVLIYWLLFGLIVSITYFWQCSDEDDDFWRVPWHKFPTYLMIFLLLPGLIICSISWLMIHSDLRKLKPNLKRKKENNGDGNFVLPDVNKERDALSRLRKKI